MVWQLIRFPSRSASIGNKTITVDSKASDNMLNSTVWYIQHSAYSCN